MIVSEILRAAKILRAMEHAHASEKGAVGLEGEMIDAPMLKQVWKINASFSFGILSRAFSGEEDDSVGQGCWFGDTFCISMTIN
jgi:hypothetical protein